MGRRGVLIVPFMELKLERCALPLPVPEVLIVPFMELKQASFKSSTTTVAS